MPRITLPLPSDGDDLTQDSNNIPLQIIAALLNGNLDGDNMRVGGTPGSIITPGSLPLAAFAAEIISSLIPVGIVLEWHSDGTAVPTGYQIADGSIITDVRSPRVGKHVANKINRFSRGVSNQDLVTTEVTAGSDDHILTVAELPSHSHTITDPGHIHGVNDYGHGHSVNDPGHSHSINGQTNFYTTNGGRFALGNQSIGNIGSTNSSVTNIVINQSGTGISIASSGTGISAQNTGSGTAHTNIPVYVGLVPIEKIF